MFARFDVCNSFSFVIRQENHDGTTVTFKRGNFVEMLSV